MTQNRSAGRDSAQGMMSGRFTEDDSLCGMILIQSAGGDPGKGMGYNQMVLEKWDLGWGKPGCFHGDNSLIVEGSYIWELWVSV